MSVIAGTLAVAIILVSVWFLVGITREWLLMRQQRQMRQRRGGRGGNLTREEDDD